MRNNLFSMRSLLLAAPLFLVSVLPLKAVPWSAEVQQDVKEQQVQNPIASNLFVGNFGINAITSTNFAPEADCLNTSRYPSGIVSAPADLNVRSISTCNFASEYFEIGAIVSGSTYQFLSSVATDYFTIRLGAADGPVVAQGVQPLSITPTATTNLFVHINANENCGTSSNCRITTMKCLSCVPVPCTTPTVSTFPFTEGFESSSSSRQCWSNEFVSGAVSWTYATGAGSGAITTAHSGVVNARFSTSSTGPKTKLVSPKFDFSDKEGATLNFWYGNQEWFGDQNELRIFYKVGSGAWTLIPGAEYTSDVNEWTEVTLNLPESDDAEEYTIAFEGYSDYSRGIVLDDITVDADDATSAPAGCLTATYGQYPSATFSPVCDGAPKSITGLGYAGEYSKVSLTADVEYTFSSSVVTDYITISDEAGTVVKAAGVTPVVYTPTANEVVRFYTHKDANCTAESISRSRLVACGEPIVIEEPDFDCFQGDGITSVFDNGYSINQPTVNRAADDFIVAEGIEFTMQQITIDVLSATAITTATINIKSDNAGLPGAIVETITMAPTESITYSAAFNFPIHHLVFDLATPIVLEEGTYWLEPSMTNANASNVFWLVTSTGSLGSVIHRSTDTGTTYSPDPAGLQGVFFVAGECELDPGTEPSEDCDQGDDSNNFENGYNITGGGTFRNADDFIVSAGSTLNVQQIELNVFSSEVPTTMNFNFFEDNAGSPGTTTVYTLTDVPVEAVAIGANFGFVIYAVFADVDLTFEEGTYWMEPVVNNVGTAYWEVTSQGTLGAYIHTKQGTGAWVADEDLFQGVFKLRCEAVEPPEENCLLSFSTVEAITRVLFTDIDNTSPADSNIPWEDFTAIEGNVGTGDTYPIALEGNTGGNWTNYFTVWVDWNQNGTYDANERYQVGSIVNSTGTDGIQATGNIAVPSSAALGTTTMRVVKNFSSYAQDPCGQYSYGQAEEYTINVTEGSGGNTGFTCEDQTVPSNDIENGLFFVGATNQQLAFDIMVGDNGFMIYGIEVNAFVSGNSDATFNAILYNDNGGLPGTQADATSGTVISSTYVGEAFSYDIYTYKVIFDTPLSVGANSTYWMEIQSDAVAWEATTSNVFGSFAAFANDNTGGDWAISTNELVYTLICEELGVSDMTSFDFAYYPNPVKDVLNITSQKSVKSVEAFNLTGQKVFANAKILNGQINVNALTAGTYVFKVTLEDGQVETFKIIKK